jgi:hypothetical protein
MFLVLSHHAHGGSPTANAHVDYACVVVPTHVLLVLLQVQLDVRWCPGPFDVASDSLSSAVSAGAFGGVDEPASCDSLCVMVMPT